MKKINLFIIILSLILSFSSIGCKPTENTIIDNTEETFGISMYNAFEKEFNRLQFDSICNADKLHKDLNNWYCFAAKEGDTGKLLVEYMYIKYNKDQEIIYRLIPIDDNTFHITKRIRNK